MCSTHGITVLCNLHQLELALHFSDRIIGLKEGEIIVNEKTKNIDPNFIHDIYGSHENQIIFANKK